METGTVKWFDARKEKRFGFIKVNGWDEDIFFHFNNGQVIIAGKTKPEFSGEAEEDFGTHTRPLRDPVVGDIIMFHVREGRKGLVASPWGTKAHYDRALNAIKNRPAPTLYRVRHSMGGWGNTATPENPEGADIVWVGTDLEEALSKFPVPKGNQSPGSDPLLPFFSHDDGFETRHWWEKKKEDGKWEHCPDPRPLSGANRQFERITHRW